MDVVVIYSLLESSNTLSFWETTDLSTDSATDPAPERHGLENVFPTDMIIIIQSKSPISLGSL